MGKKKKNDEPIVIDPRELAVTNLGKLDQKENGPFFAILWIIIFVAGIIGLPYLSEYMNEQNPPTIPSMTNPGGTSGGSTGTTEPEEDVFTKESGYYRFSETTAITMNEVTFDNFVFDLNQAQISLKITNNNVQTTLFQTYNFYLELHTEDKTLLQRIRLTDSEIKTSAGAGFTYDLDTTQDLSKIGLFRVVLKAPEDYPTIELSTNAQNQPILECKKDTEVITYIFEKKENTYLLKSLKETLEYYEDASDYTTVYNHYISLSSTYSTVIGVTSYMSSLSNGFYYQTEVDLEKVMEMNYQRLFTKPIYYNKDTEAKVIDFELKTSGYKCN